MYKVVHHNVTYNAEILENRIVEVEVEILIPT